MIFDRAGEMGEIRGLLDGDAAPSAVVDLVLRKAALIGASDVHVEPTGSGVEVRFRLDGVLRTVATAPPGWDRTLVARLKVLAGLATYRTDIPQDGRIPGDGLPVDGDLRLSTYPTVRGEKAVVRLLAPRSRALRLAELGLSDRSLGVLEAGLAGREGLVALTGPAGSGKTTTLYAAVRHIHETDHVPRQIVTVEDPVESLLDGITQTETNPPAGLSFASCLRSILRQDPEVILVGEVRDRETAALAFESALSGHLVLTTVHAGTAPAVFGRLLEMGIEPSTLTSVLRAAMAVRLVRRSCPDCGTSIEGRWSAPGCEACFGTGFRGRHPLDEVLTLTPALRAAVLERADAVRLRLLATEAGFVSLAVRGRELVERGLTTREEVARVLAGSDSAL